MRSFEVPVIGRIKDGVYMLDMLTVFEDEIATIAGNLLKLGGDR